MALFQKGGVHFHPFVVPDSHGHERCSGRDRGSAPLGCIVPVGLYCGGSGGLLAAPFLIPADHHHFDGQHDEQGNYKICHVRHGSGFPPAPDLASFAPFRAVSVNRTPEGSAAQKNNRLTGS